MAVPGTQPGGRTMSVAANLQQSKDLKNWTTVSPAPRVPVSVDHNKGTTVPPVKIIEYHKNGPTNDFTYTAGSTTNKVQYIEKEPSIWNFYRITTAEKQ